MRNPTFSVRRLGLLSAAGLLMASATLPLTSCCCMHRTVCKEHGKAMHRTHKQAIGTTYTCPMHPGVAQKGPGVCPKCGMNLTPKE
jgi:hypothetical protein